MDKNKQTNRKRQIDKWTNRKRQTDKKSDKQANVVQA